MIWSDRGGLASTIVPGVDWMRQGPLLGSRGTDQPFPASLKATERYSHSLTSDWVLGGVLG